MATDDTVERLRTDLSVDQLRNMERDIRESLVYLKAAHKLLTNLPGGSNLEDLEDIIDEAEGSIELLREARGA